ncbi:MAG: efflux RND transporter periplasmic adaptor subunit [Nitrospirota bacterium]
MNILSRFLFLLLIYIIALSGCSSREPNSSIAKESTDDILSVDVIKTVAKDITDRYKVVGIITSDREVKVSAEIGGIVKKLMADKGDKISKGDTISLLDNSQLSLRLEEKKAILDKTITLREKIEKDYRRKSYLFENKMISESEINKITFDFKIAQADERLANIAVSLLEDEIEDTRIISPMDGIVTELYVEEGEMVSKGSTIAVVSDYTRFILKGGLSEEEAVHVKRGVNAEVIIDALGGVSIDGVVKFIGIQSGNPVGSIPVEIEIIDKNGLILPGMVGKGIIKGKTQMDVIILPQSILWKESGQNIVFIASKGKAIARKVELGSIHRDGIEITNGIKNGEKIIVPDDQNIIDGARIRVMD